MTRERPKKVLSAVPWLKKRELNNKMRSKIYSITVNGGYVAPFPDIEETLKMNYILINDRHMFFSYLYPFVYKCTVKRIVLIKIYWLRNKLLQRYYITQPTSTSVLLSLLKNPIITIIRRHLVKPYTINVFQVDCNKRYLNWFNNPNI